MELVAELTNTETIALWGVIVAAITGIIVPVVLLLLKKSKEEHSQHMEVVRINGDGTTIGDNPVVTIDKRQGVDAEFILSKAMEAS